MRPSGTQITLGRVLSHDNSVALLIDGEVVAAIAAERLSGHKHDHEHNDLAIRYCLEMTGLTIEDIDIIVQNSPKHYFRNGSESSLINDGDPRVYTISHHLAHAWSVWATCPFDEAAIIVVDGRGNFVPPGRDVVLYHGEDGLLNNGGHEWQIEVESIYKADCNGINLVEKYANRGLPTSIGARFSRQDGLYPGEYSGYYQYAGLGALYEQASLGLFQAALDGGKVMGLAAYAKPEHEKVLKMLTPDIHSTFNLGFKWLFDLPGPISVGEHFQEAAQLAANVQLALEVGLEALVSRAHKLTGCANLCLTGGVALNCRANERIHRAGIFDKIFIQPACNDAGASIGCAFHGYSEALHGSLKHRRYIDFLGRSYDNEVPAILHRWKSSVAWEQVDDIVVESGKLLAEGLVIGWYRGGSEFGPRALGHRSIFAFPGDTDLRDRLNRDIKRREPFRPFAPVVTIEAAAEIFDLEGESPYMLRTVPVRSSYREALAAVTHIDGTARVQTVARGDEPIVYALLEWVGSSFGLPVLLNTSLNTAGYPIVETPDDAIMCLFSSGLDALIFDGWVVRRRFNNLDDLLASKSHSRFRLLPNVAIRTKWADNKHSAELTSGPRKRELTSSEANLLIEAAKCDTIVTQLEIVTTLGMRLRLFDELIREGWALGESLKQGE